MAVIDAPKNLLRADIGNIRQQIGRLFPCWKTVTICDAGRV
jgi:hypothetical protein